MSRRLEFDNIRELQGALNRLIAFRRSAAHVSVET
jgi:hypothetical protein